MEHIKGSEGSHVEIKTKMSNAGDQSQPNSHAQFYSSLVKLRGLDLLLQKHTGNNEDKRGLIDSYLKEEDMSEHIVYGILSFIHQEFFFPSSPLKKADLLRMKKAISLLVELMNKQVLHPVMKNSSNLCEDFLTQVSGQLMTPFRQILLYSLTVVQVRHQNLFPKRPPQLFPNYQQLWKKLGSGFSLHQSCSWRDTNSWRTSAGTFLPVGRPSSRQSSQIFPLQQTGSDTLDLLWSNSLSDDWLGKWQKPTTHHPQDQPGRHSELWTQTDRLETLVGVYRPGGLSAKFWVVLGGPEDRESCQEDPRENIREAKLVSVFWKFQCQVTW